MSTITLQDEDRIDDLLALWRWRDELDYRLRKLGCDLKLSGWTLRNRKDSKGRCQSSSR